MTESAAEQNETAVSPLEKKPMRFCSALIKKLSFAVIGLSLLFAFLAFAVSLGYREDTSKIPSFRIEYPA